MSQAHAASAADAWVNASATDVPPVPSGTAAAAGVLVVVGLSVRYGSLAMRGSQTRSSRTLCCASGDSAKGPLVVIAGPPAAGKD